MTTLVAVLLWTTVFGSVMCGTPGSPTTDLTEGDGVATSRSDVQRDPHDLASSKEYFNFFHTPETSGKGKPSKEFKYLTPIIISAINKLAHLLPIAKLTLLTLFALVLFAKKAFLISIASFAYVLYDSMYAKGKKVPRITIKDRGPEPHHEYVGPHHEYTAPHHEYPQHHEYPAHHHEYPAHHHEYPPHHHEYPTHHDYSGHHEYSNHQGYDASGHHDQSGGYFPGHNHNPLWNKVESFMTPQKVSRVFPIAREALDSDSGVLRRLLKSRLMNHRAQSKKQDDDMDIPIDI